MIQTKLQKTIWEVDKVIQKILTDDLKIIKELKEYLLKSGGKKFRPLVHFSLCKLLHYKGSKWKDVGAISELVHAASLFHDDVIDASELRRGLPTVNNKFGNKVSILWGDLLLASSLKHLNSLNSPELLNVFTSVIKDLSISELIQMEWEKKFELNLETYNKIIFGKTASLFGAVCKSSGILAGNSEPDLKKLYQFGIELGLLFQIRDDYLDYFVESKEIGKANFQDFQNGLITYPVLVLKNKLNNEELKQMKSSFYSQKTKSELKTLLLLFEKYKIKLELQKKINNTVDSLCQFLSQFKTSNIKQLMIDQLDKLRIDISKK